MQSKLFEPIRLGGITLPPAANTSFRFWSAAVTSVGFRQIVGSCLACGFPSVPHGQGHSGSLASEVSCVRDPAACVRVARSIPGKP